MLGKNELDLLELALREDLGPSISLEGDITTSATIAPGLKAKSRIIARETLVVCGNEIASAVFTRLDPSIQYAALIPDSQVAQPDAVIAEVSGSFGAILSGERTALNFMQRLSGIASITRRLVAAVQGEKACVIETRKTTPGLRGLEKYAVRAGGGSNHRMGLYDAFLIKNNHIDALGGDVAKAVRLCREKSLPGVKVQVEVRSELELREALKEHPDAVLLDNMSPALIRSCLSIIHSLGLREKIQVEASGGIVEANLKDYAATGVDFISLGALTHSVRSSDISLRFVGA